MDTIDTAAMVQRFKERAAAVRKRNMPPIAGAERVVFIKQAQLDYQDFLLLADAEISMDGGILTVDLRPAICDATIRGEGHLEVETKAAMENIANALPTDGNLITPGMLDSKADLQSLIDGSEMFRVVKTVAPIQPGFSLSHGYLA
tara:strand:+ start:24 stop:461 length:438 start_codon:yes stop_codon:yes gene_type:complete